MKKRIVMIISGTLCMIVLVLILYETISFGGRWGKYKGIHIFPFDHKVTVNDASEVYHAHINLLIVGEKYVDAYMNGECNVYGIFGDERRQLEYDYYPIVRNYGEIYFFTISVNIPANIVCNGLEIECGNKFFSGRGEIVTSVEESNTPFGFDSMFDVCLYHDNANKADDIEYIYQFVNHSERSVYIRPIDTSFYGGAECETFFSKSYDELMYGSSESPDERVRNKSFSKDIMLGPGKMVFVYVRVKSDDAYGCDRVYSPRFELGDGKSIVPDLVNARSSIGIIAYSDEEKNIGILDMIMEKNK